MASSPEGISIGTVSGGIINFGGAVYIAPISVTKTTSGSGEGNTGASTMSNTGTSSGSVIGPSLTSGSRSTIPRSGTAAQNNITNLIDFIRTFIE